MKSNNITHTVETLPHATLHPHEELPFWRRYIFSTDHKVIGIWYALTSMIFLFLGFSLMMLMRWQLAYPGEPIPLIGSIFGDERAPGGVMLPEFYNQLGAMHGTIMVFLGVVPLAVGAFGNYVMPLQIGAPDMAFPKLNMASYWVYFVGGVTMLASFFVPGGSAQSGWTSYPPLSDITFPGFLGGQTFWLLGMVFLITSSLLGSINFITTILQLRAKGLSFMRLPFFVWAQHMFLTGMGTAISSFFQTTTMIISIPSVIILSGLFLTLHGASIRFNTPMLFALAFLPMFGIGGLTGLPLGFNVSDIHLHDTYYIIAHFHYVVAPGTIFALFAGIYYWFPKVSGRMMNETLGKLHFWLSLIFMNLVFQPMFAQGMAGLNRRMFDGGATYAASDQGIGLAPWVLHQNIGVSHAAWMLGLAQIPFILNFFISMGKGRKIPSDNP